MATRTKFADEKLADELLSDDELDNVAGGAELVFGSGRALNGETNINPLKGMVTVKSNLNEILR